MQGPLRGAVLACIKQFIYIKVGIHLIENDFSNILDKAGRNRSKIVDYMWLILFIERNDSRNFEFIWKYSSKQRFVYYDC